METKGITCKIPLDLHNRVSEEIRETESTMSKFIEMIITEHYEKGAVTVMEKGRTLAFQVSEELFQKVKKYLDRYEKTYHHRLTQKEFVIGLIEQALEEAEEEFEAARAAAHEEQAESGWEATEASETDEDEEVPDCGEPEDWGEESNESESPTEDEGLESEEAPAEGDGSDEDFLGEYPYPNEETLQEDESEAGYPDEDEDTEETEESFEEETYA